MASPPTLTCGTLAEASVLRQDAQELLNRLVVNGEATERRLQETGRRDPIRTITGLTAIERAIASTRGMIAEMDALLTELDHAVLVADARTASDGRETTVRRGHGQDLAFAKAGMRSRGMLVATR